MYCSNCGAKIDDGVNFCSHCGIEISITWDGTDGKSETGSDIENADAKQWVKPDAGTCYEEDPFLAFSQTIEKKSIKNHPVIQKIIAFWQQFSFREKCLLCGMIVGFLFVLIAFLSGKTVASVCAVFQLLLLVFALLVCKGIIKQPKPWIGTLSVVIAVFLLLPYFVSFSAGNKYKRIAWNEIALGEMIPKPEMKKAEVLKNTEDMLSLCFQADAEAYSDYIAVCESDGFVIDAMTQSKSYTAFNDKGYRIIVEYDNDQMLQISFYAPLELTGIQFPTQGLAARLPVPETNKGKIVENSKEHFSGCFGEMTHDAFSAYIEQCKNAGFVSEGIQTENKYTAKDGEGYTVNIDYLGFNIIGISLDIPVYDISMTVSCERNLMFSRYDVEVYFDDEYMGTVEHGDFENYELHVNMGTHAVKFESVEYDGPIGGLQLDIANDAPIHIKVNCYNSGIEARVVSDAGESVEPETNGGFEGEETTASIQTDSSDPTEATEAETAVEESTADVMPVMKGAFLSEVCSAAAALGVSEQPFSDEDWKDGTKMRTLWNSQQSLAVDICYSVDSSEILYGEIVTFQNASVQEQKDFICGMAPYLCPPEDSEALSEWVKSNIGKKEDITVHGFTYELSFGVTGSFLYNAGCRTWEAWAS